MFSIPLMLRGKPCICMHFLCHPLRKISPSLLQTRLTSSLSVLPLLAATAGDLAKLRQIHAYMIVTGAVQSDCLSSQLLASPALCDPNYAHLIFTQISHPNLFIRNTMIRKLAESNDEFANLPLSLYRQMLDAGLRPNAYTFLFLIKALASRSELREGREIHCNVLKFGFGMSQFVLCALIGFYAGYSYIDDARQVFDEMSQPSLVLWTAMIRAYVRQSRPENSLALFKKMSIMGPVPDSIAMATIISACNQLGDLRIGKVIHNYINKSGIEMDVFVRSGLLSMYADCGTLELARQVFDEMPQRNVVAWNTMIHHYAKKDCLEVARELFETMPKRDAISWNTIIAGFSQAGECKEALALFHEMELSFVRPTRVTMLTVLSSCATIGALDMGIWIHAYIEKHNMNWDGLLDSALIDMYSKCGSIDKALQVFDKIPKKGLFAWTSIICGLAMHGRGKHALELFSLMQEASIEPDSVTLLGVLNACVHARLLDQGCQIFASMDKIYNITPKIEHYGCMVDLLGRTGRLQEAHKLVMEMPMKPNVAVWGALLSGCMVYNDVELGEFVTQKLRELDPSDPGIHILMSNIYAEACKWDDVRKLRKEVREMGRSKTPGCSWIEVNGMVHQFVVRDNSHPHIEEIHCMLEKMKKHCS